MMKSIRSLALLTLLVGLTAYGQGTTPPVVTSADMFTTPGLYFRCYSNPFDPTSTSPTPFALAPGVLGTANSSPQIWDFSVGPTNITYRFDYLSPTGVVQAADFPQATVVEKQTDEATGNSQFLFFQQVSGVGRTVYGFYTDQYQGLLDPSNVFQQPIVDFPDRITFGQTWTTVATFVSNVGVSDPTDPTAPPGGVAVQTTMTSNLKVDAWGTIVLPDALGSFSPGLRINEDVTIDTAFDDGSGSGFQHIETDYTRNYYWVMPGRGIVAEVASIQGSNGTPVPDNFTTATQFWRMFETNKKPSSGPGGGCVTPDAVNNLSIKLGPGQVLLRWPQANCASSYQLQYTTNAFDTASWKTLTTVTNQLLVLDTTKDQQRFYRVVSIK
jgi:hypothetical protein